MTDNILELTRRKILGAAGAVGLAGAGTGYATGALFSDGESFANNAIQAGTTNLTVQAKVVERSAPVDADPGSPPGVNIQETIVDGNPGAGLTFTDLKPGDEFVLGFNVVVRANPMYVTLEARNTDDGEGTNTEPETTAQNNGTNPDTQDGSGAGNGSDPVGDGTGDDAGDLDNQTLVTIGHDESDGMANDFTWDTGGLNEPSNPEFGSGGGISLTSFLDDLQDGVVYRDSSGAPLGHGSDDPAEIGGGDNVTHWVYVRVPTDVGNEIQGDTVSFDLVWNAKQVRNNDISNANFDIPDQQTIDPLASSTSFGESSTITVSELSLPADGFVAFYSDDGGSPGELLAHTFVLDQGQYTDEEFVITSTVATSNSQFFGLPGITDAEDVIAVVYTDDGDSFYESVPDRGLTQDPRYTVGGETVTDAGRISV